MIVHVHPDARITLDEPDTFTEFSIRATGLAFEAVVAAFGGDARAGNDDHVWISIARLHALGEEHGGPDWRKGCDGMIRYAATKAWLDEGEAHVRAHLEN